MTAQKHRMSELTTTNAQLHKTLTDVRTHETKLSVEAASLRADLYVAWTRDTTFQTSFDEVTRVSDEHLAQLETLVGDAVLSARAELMQEFKDGKSREWDPDY